MVYPCGMSPPSKPADAKDTRDQRLAAALRENLKRRKAQARAKEQTKKPVAGKD
jgi:hypothetical protein